MKRPTVEMTWHRLNRQTHPRALATHLEDRTAFVTQATWRSFTAPSLAVARSTLASIVQ